MERKSGISIEIAYQAIAVLYSHYWQWVRGRERACHIRGAVASHITGIGLQGWVRAYTTSAGASHITAVGSHWLLGNVPLLALGYTELRAANSQIDHTRIYNRTHFSKVWASHSTPRGSICTRLEPPKCHIMPRNDF